MAADWEALQQALLYAGWPGFLLVSAYAVWRTIGFYRGLRNSAPGLLVLLTISGWTVTLAGAAFIMTLFLEQDAQTAGPVVLPIFILWAGSLITIVWVVQRWGQEAATLDTYYGEVEKMERMKSGFINHIAHELNTPITPLRMQVAVFRKQTLGPLTEKQFAALDRMDRSIQRLSRLVDQVLMANQIQTSGLHLEHKSVDLLELAIEAADGAMADMPGLLVEVAGESVHAEVDRARLGYALQALLEHLARSMPGDSRLRMAVAHEGSRVRIDVHHGGPHLDEGAFGMFHDPVRASQGEGLGVGLFNVQGILALHGGVITAPAQDPSLVRIRIPLVAVRRRR